MKSLLTVKTLEKTVGLVSLGCSKNLVDSEVMLGLLQGAGYKITSDVDQADAVIVNTCGFLGAAVEESLQTLSEMTALKKNGRCQGGPQIPWFVHHCNSLEERLGVLCPIPTGVAQPDGKGWPAESVSMLPQGPDRTIWAR